MTLPSENWGYVICLVYLLNYLAAKAAGHKQFSIGVSPCVFMFMSVIMCEYLWVRELCVFMQLHKFYVTVSIYVFFHFKFTFGSFEATTHTPTAAAAADASRQFVYNIYCHLLAQPQERTPKSGNFAFQYMYYRQVWHTPCKSCLFQILNFTPTAPLNWLLIFRSLSVTSLCLQVLIT